MTVKRILAASLVLGTLVCNSATAQAPINPPQPTERAMGTYSGEVVSVLGLTDLQTGAVLGRMARLRIRNQPFDVRCLGGREFGCHRLNRGAFVEVRAVLTPSTIEVLSVRVIQPPSQ